MELILFDLDGTLLDRSSEISPYTKETLRLLAERGIAYTVATGRTLHTARDLLMDSEFRLPLIFKNGVMVWDPVADEYLLENYLRLEEVRHVLEALREQALTAFICTVGQDGQHGVYHTTLKSRLEADLAKHFGGSSEVDVHPVDAMPGDVEITNISAMGDPRRVTALEDMIADEPHLVAYAGTALEGNQYRWIDIHHTEASKGAALLDLKKRTGANQVICFGDSENDLSMFAVADECYAPENAKPALKSMATAVIGHHDEDGVAKFLRERFQLPEIA